MKGFVIWPGRGGSCLSLAPSNSPTTLRELSLGVMAFPPSTQQHPQRYVTCLFRVHFSATSGEEKEREKLILFPSYLEGSTKNPLVIETVVNDQAEPPGWTERGRFSRAC